MHRHACGVGHYWDCNGTALRYSEEPTVCMCLDHDVSMEGGDHSQCTIELLDCPFHRTGHADSSQSEALTRDPIEQGWESIQIPDNLEKMLQNWNNEADSNIGWCLICNSAIRTEGDLIPGTNTHNCAEGRVLEAKAHEGRPEVRQAEGNTVGSGSTSPSGDAVHPRGLDKRTRLRRFPCRSTD